jgi:hypothetical protein
LLVVVVRFICYVRYGYVLLVLVTFVVGSCGFVGLPLFTFPLYVAVWVWFTFTVYGLRFFGSVAGVRLLVGSCRCGLFGLPVFRVRFALPLLVGCYRVRSG